MRAIKTCFALLPLAVAACTPAPPLTDYCAVASRVELRDLCAPGELPAASGSWGSCSILTRADAERLAAEAAKFDSRCREVRP